MCLIKYCGLETVQFLTRAELITKININYVNNVYQMTDQKRNCLLTSNMKILWILNFTEQPSNVYLKILLLTLNLLLIKIFFITVFKTVIFCNCLSYILIIVPVLLLRFCKFTYLFISEQERTIKTKVK